ncbi:hypothetical protein DB346_11275 [Verrucomicrobia bacterium LW23]|nr:hypothetical protein DB346_11275 [Verrucomicrobia bacterium LW23]
MMRSDLRDYSDEMELSQAAEELVDAEARAGLAPGTGGAGRDGKDTNKGGGEGHNPRRDEAVVLIHGLWMTGFEFAALAVRLRRSGYITKRFPYSDMRHGLVDNADKLNDFAQSIHARRVHFVAHSLGGIVMLELLRRHQQRRHGRAVAIGSPFLSTWTASRVSKWPVVGPMLGRTMKDHLRQQSADPAVMSWNGGGEGAVRDFGVIAGTYPMGAGKIVGMRGLCDGTVLVEETKLPGATDHIELNSSHFGLLVSRNTHAQVDSFLQQGKFCRAALPSVSASATIRA